MSFSMVQPLGKVRVECRLKRNVLQSYCKAVIINSIRHNHLITAHFEVDIKQLFNDCVMLRAGNIECFCIGRYVDV